MILSDVSIKRPVFAAVISLMLVTIGLIAFTRLPLRELPNIDPPVVSIDVSYPGAAAGVVETRVTQVIEDAVDRLVRGERDQRLVAVHVGHAVDLRDGLAEVADQRQDLFERVDLGGQRRIRRVDTHDDRVHPLLLLLKGRSYLH